MKTAQILLLLVLTLTYLSNAQQCPDGECYSIIPGCFLYQNISKCKLCANQFYLKEDGLCALKATTATQVSKTSATPNSNIQNSTRDVHQFNIKNHPNLKGQSASRVHKIQCWRGQLITIIYTGSRITTLVDCEGAMTEIISGEPIVNYDDPVQIIQKIHQEYPQLKQFEIFDVKARPDIYQIEFYAPTTNQLVHGQIQRKLLKDFSTSYRIGYYEFYRSVLLLIENDLSQFRDKLGKNEPEGKYLGKSNTIVFTFQYGTVSVFYGKCKFIVNEPSFNNQMGFKYNNDANFMDNYLSTLQSLPYDEYPPISKVTENVHSNGTKMYIVTFVSGNTDYLIPVDYELVFETFNTQVQIVSIRLNYQYVLQEIQSNNKSSFVALGNCYSYSYIGAYCRKCASFFQYLNDETVCNTILGIKCANYTANGTCIRCIKGYDINEAGQCEELTIDFPDCEIVVNRTCIKCAQGFTQNGLGGCRKLDPLCLMTQNGICIICVPTYVIAHDNCVKQITFCDSYSNMGCIACQPGYVLIPTQPYHTCDRFVPDPNCLNYDRNNKCDVCQQNYFLSSFNFCYPKIVNCLSYNDYDGQCEYCINNYRVFENRCLSLNDVLINCARDLQYSKCKECLSGMQHVLIDGKCTCQDGFYFKNDACLPIVNNCQIVNYLTSKCQVCNTGFYQFAGKCVEPVENCFGYTSEGVCTGCMGGLTLTMQGDRLICA